MRVADVSLSGTLVGTCWGTVSRHLQRTTPCMVPERRRCLANVILSQHIVIIRTYAVSCRPPMPGLSTLIYLVSDLGYTSLLRISISTEPKTRIPT
jgi:hypothetical protein